MTTTRRVVSVASFILLGVVIQVGAIGITSWQKFDRLKELNTHTCQTYQTQQVLSAKQIAIFNTTLDPGLYITNRHGGLGNPLENCEQEQLLISYLVEADFYPSRQGIFEVASALFQTTPKKLTMAQTITLAALLNNSNGDSLKINTITQALLNKNMITHQESSEAHTLFSLIAR